MFALTRIYLCGKTSDMCMMAVRSRVVIYADVKLF